jgi:hypothetical protein
MFSTSESFMNFSYITVIPNFGMFFRARILIENQASQSTIYAENLTALFETIMQS